MTTTPWGKGEQVALARIEQRAGERRFATLLEVVELPSGERLVRLAYSTDGRSRRGPVTLRERDLERLRSAILGDPVVRAAVLGAPAEGAPANPARGAEHARARPRRRPTRAGGGA